MFGVPAERVAGSREVAQLLGVTRQRVGQLARADKTFPRPGTVLSGGPVWHRAGIEAWVAAHGRAGSAGGRMQPTVGELLAAAERASRELRHGYVSREHFWLVLADPAFASAVGQALASLGVDEDETRRAFLFATPIGEKVRRSTRMNPAVQQQLERADRRACDHERDAVTDIDVALAWLDADDAEDGRDLVLGYLARRGLDRAELRRRLLAIEADASAAQSFERRELPKPRPRRRKRPRPAWLPPLMPNPLGRDPWERHPWGSSFAMRQDQRMYKADNAQWFFYFDADGYFVRTTDGRPVGYRWPVEEGAVKRLALRAKRYPTRRARMEVLPMPTSDVAYWPGHRHMQED
jgi:predicted DNA-binding transcriptional regulator AlpA